MGAFSVITNLRMDLRFKLYWKPDAELYLGLTRYSTGLLLGRGCSAVMEAGVPVARLCSILVQSSTSVPWSSGCTGVSFIGRLFSIFTSTPFSFTVFFLYQMKATEPSFVSLQQLCQHMKWDKATTITVINLFLLEKLLMMMSSRGMLYSSLLGIRNIALFVYVHNFT